jgi:hypothetical protein
MDPQTMPCAAHVVGVQPHTFATPGLPPPHVAGAVHVPQSSVPPHVSEMLPQFFPWSAQLFGVHGVSPHLLGPPPPQ